MGKERIYKASDYYMVRTPVYSLKEYVDFSKNNDTLYEKIIDLFDNNNLLRESILVASKSLYDSLKYRKGDKQKVIEAFSKYYIRMTTRTTPFGLFSGVGIGKYGSENNILNSKRIGSKKRARVDYQWLSSLIKEIEVDINVVSKLNVKANTTLLEKGYRLENKYISHYGEKYENKSEKFSTINVQYNEVVKSVIYLAKDYISIENIVDTLKENMINIPRQSIQRFVVDLLTKEYIISDLRPPMNEFNQLDYLIRKIEGMKVEGYDKLNKLKGILQIINNYNNSYLGEGEEIFIQLVEEMTNLHESKNYVQVDMYVELDKNEIKSSIAEEAEELMEFLSILASGVKQRDYLIAYKNDFKEKYSEGQEVPLLELIDEDRGLGYPATYVSPVSSKTLNSEFGNSNTDKIQTLITQKITNKQAIKEREVVLSKKDIDALNLYKIEDERLPESLELNLLLGEKSTGEYSLWIGPNWGSGKLGKMYGRFSDLYDEETIEKISSDIKRSYELSGDNVINAELTVLHSSGRHGNVTINPNYADYELPIAITSSKERNKTLDIDDILVGIEDNSFYLKSKKFNKRVLLSAHNMLVPEATNNLYRILLELSNDQQALNFLLPLFLPTKTVSYIPRIKYKNITIFPESWVLNPIDAFSKTDLKDFNKFLENFKVWKEKNDLNRYVYISEGDNRLLIDLDNNVHLNLLFSLIKKDFLKLIRFEEFQHDFNMGNLTNKIQAVEIVIPFLRTVNSDKSLSDTNKEKHLESYHKDRVHLPFDNWIYTKLYCDKGRQDEVIGKYILEFLNSNKEKGIIDKGFYIRYMDNKHHIRLRILANPEKQFEAFKIINDLIAQLYSLKVISEASFDTYFREIERYGGINTIESAESLFDSESKLIGEILNLKLNNKLNIDLKMIAVICLIHFMESYGMSYEEQFELFDSFIRHDEFKDQFNKQRKMYIKLTNSDCDWNGLRTSENGDILIDLLNSREKSIAAYRTSIDEAKEKETLSNSEKNILLGVMHMYCNRLFGINRNIEREVMALVRQSLYALKYFKKKERDLKIC